MRKVSLLFVSSGRVGVCVCVCVSEGGCVDELRVVVFGGPMKLATHDYASSEE